MEDYMLELLLKSKYVMLGPCNTVHIKCNNERSIEVAVVIKDCTATFYMRELKQDRTKIIQVAPYDIINSYINRLLENSTNTFVRRLIYQFNEATKLVVVE